MAGTERISRALKPTINRKGIMQATLRPNPLRSLSESPNATDPFARIVEILGSHKSKMPDGLHGQLTGCLRQLVQLDGERKIEDAVLLQMLTAKVERYALAAEVYFEAIDGIVETSKTEGFFESLCPHIQKVTAFVKQQTRRRIPTEQEVRSQLEAQIESRAAQIKLVRTIGLNSAADCNN